MHSKKWMQGFLKQNFYLQDKISGGKETVQKVKSEIIDYINKFNSEDNENALLLTNFCEEWDGSYGAVGIELYLKFGDNFPLLLRKRVFEEIADNLNKILSKYLKKAYAFFIISVTGNGRRIYCDKNKTYCDAENTFYSENSFLPFRIITNVEEFFILNNEGR